LLDGIEKCGVGNWKVIADFIGTKQSKQCEEHYWELYMGVHGYCLPPKTLDQDVLVPTESILHKIVASSSSSTSSSSYVPLNQCPSVMEGYKKGEIVERDKGKEAGRGKDKQDVLTKIAQMPGGDLNGFIPLREDFDVEHENDAEILLADMEFFPDDHPSERELKLQVVRIYNAKLAERDKRKRFVIDRRLIDFKKQQQLDRRRSKEERELVARLRMFARFHSPEEHEALVDGLIKAKKLRQQIAVYQHYRRMGIRTLDQARQYEIDRKKREAEIKARKQREGAPYLFETGRSSLGGAAGQPSGVAGAKKGGRRGRGEEDGDGAGDSVADGSAGKASNEMVDLSKAPGADLLAEKELELCAKIPMLPMHYLAAKDAVVREAYRNGTLTAEGVRRVVRLDVPASTKVYDFFVREMFSDDRSKKKRKKDEGGAMDEA